MKETFEPPQRVAIRSWAGRIDVESLRTLRRLARWDRLAGPIVVLPDVHAAGDVCVGTVLVTEDAVLPTSVGQDLGCGMCTARLGIDADALASEDWTRLVARLWEAIPAGRRAHREVQPLPQTLLERPLSTRQLAHARAWLGARHFGTLGSGNHFVELQRGPDGVLWVTVHSGSRGAGAAVANHHARIARRDGALPWIPRGSPEADAFLADHDWAIAYAKANRTRMLDAVVEAVSGHLGERVHPGEVLDVTHNLIVREMHGGRDLLVHRKGAMPMPRGARGLIPGSMGTASYLVEGLGCEASYATSSHGAGRQLSRAEAHRRVTLKDLRRQTRHVALPPDPRVLRALVEESPVSYKDIREVLRQQEDLVRPVLRLEPRAVLKGG